MKRSSCCHKLGRQPGDPAKLAEAIVSLSKTDKPPLRFVAGSVALGAADQKLADMRNEFDRWRQLSMSTDGTFGDNASVASIVAQICRT